MIKLIDTPAIAMVFETEGGYMESYCMSADTQMYNDMYEFNKEINDLPFVFIYSIERCRLDDDWKLFIRWCCPPEIWLHNLRIRKCLGHQHEFEDFLEWKTVPYEVWKEWQNDKTDLQ